MIARRCAIIASILWASLAQAQTPPLTVPPGHACTERELLGVWKLIGIAEQPRGDASADFAINPHQYLGFRTYNILSRYAGGTDPQGTQELLRALSAAPNQPLEQYLASANGGMYFYRGGTATDGFSCLMVQQDVSPFRRGDMVLFTLNQTAPSLIKIYRRVALRAGQQAANPNRQPGRRVVRINPGRRQ